MNACPTCGYPMVWSDLTACGSPLSTCTHRLSARKTQGCASGVPQAMSFTIGSMTEQSFPPDDEYRPGVNVTEYRLPACWEDMEYLGLNPVTGEPMGGAA